MVDPQHIVSNSCHHEILGVNDIKSDNSIDVAVLSNTHSLSHHLDSVVELNPIELPHDTLRKLLFSNAGFFHISKVNESNKSLALNLQTYSKNFFNKVKFNLNEQLLGAYSNKHSQSVSQISSISKIQLFKEIKHLGSLVNFIGTQSTLSYDECINNLIDNSVIEKVSNLKTSAEVIFKLSANVHSEVLGVTTSVVFHYKTHLPGYKNKCENNECVIPYSKCENKPLHHFKERKDEDTDSHVSYEKEDSESHVSFDDYSDFNTIAQETLGSDNITLWTK